jgi:hypothetical protein
LIRANWRAYPQTMFRTRSAGLIVAAFVGGVLLAVGYIAFGLPSGPASAVDRADLVSNVITSLGLLAAGLWALFTFVLFRSGVTNLDIKIDPEVQPFLRDVRMLLVTIVLRNTGQVMIEAGSEGCRLWVRRLPVDTPRDQPLNLDSGELVINGLDLLAEYDKSFPYEIEPGAEYHEFCAVPVAPGELLAIRATFYLGGKEDDAISERRLLFVSTRD